jgi:hypothetical protein
MYYINAPAADQWPTGISLEILKGAAHGNLKNAASIAV